MNPVAPTHVLVVGYGSAGRRHAADCREAGAIVAVCDPVAADAAAADGFDVIDFASRSAVDPGRFDAVVLAGPSAGHARDCVDWLTRVPKVLVEKPLALSPAELDLFAGVGAERIAVGYNLRFHPPVAAMLAAVAAGAAGRPLGVRLHFGGYLPDWRPGVDYRTTYAARPELGGGVLFDSSHELDMLCGLFGADDTAFTVAGAVVARISDLELGTEDTVRAVLRHEPSGAAISLELDYVSRRYRRGIEVVGTDATVRLDWDDASITRETASTRDVVTDDTPVRDSYRRQAEAFLAWVRGEAPMPVGAAGGAAVVRLCAAIRAAAAGKPHTD